MKVGGVKGIFEAEFRAMEDKLDEVRRILAGTNVTRGDLDHLRDSLTVIRYTSAFLTLRSMGWGQIYFAKNLQIHLFPDDQLQIRQFSDSQIKI